MNTTYFHRLATRAACFVIAACAIAFFAGRALAADATPAAVEQIPVQTFFRKAANTGAVLSPNQRYLAALTPVNGRRNVVIVDLKTKAAHVLTNYEIRDVWGIVWANNDRIIYRTGDLQGIEFRGDGGLFSVNRDGTTPKILVEPIVSSKGFGFVWRTSEVLTRIKGNTDEVMVSANDRSADSEDVYRMNVMTGRKSLVTLRSPGYVKKWVLDADYQPRAALSIDLEKKRWWFSYRAADSEAWTTGAQWDENLKGVMVPIAFDPTNSRFMYVGSNMGRDTMALFRFDTSTGKLGDLIYGDDRYDVFSFCLLGAYFSDDGELLFAGTEEEPGKVVGLRYEADKEKTIWFDEAAARGQAAVDAALPNTLNQFSPGGRRALVFASSDVNPGEYFIFDRDARTLEETGLRRRPWIDAKKMAPMKYVTWTARDGMVIGGYLTLPLNYKTGSPVPLVLHPHGGPWAKDNWGYDSEVQFMANRGFAVLQPNFRGSTGYGARHLVSSYRQWGGTMIDDMLDGVDWAIKQGYADPGRIGVYGASYGGYATLMAMVKRPEMFKWGINYVGVTDLAVHQDTQIAQLWGKFGPLAKVLIGDQNADKQVMETQSPARMVSRIASPVFHAYGGEDPNVDYANGKEIRSAFDKAGKRYEWMFEADEGHGYRTGSHVFDFYGRFDKFIQTNTPPAKPNR